MKSIYQKKILIEKKGNLEFKNFILNICNYKEEFEKKNYNTIIDNGDKGIIYSLAINSSLKNCHKNKQDDFLKDMIKIELLEKYYIEIIKSKNTIAVKMPIFSYNNVVYSITTKKIESFEWFKKWLSTPSIKAFYSIDVIPEATIGRLDQDESEYIKEKNLIVARCVEIEK